MSQQTINIGSAANDGTGDPLRTSFTKSNGNFTELYAAADAKVAKAGDTMTGALAITNTTASTSSGTGALTVVGGVGIGGKTYAANPVSIGGATITDLATSTLAVAAPDQNSWGFVVNNLTYGNGPTKGFYIAQANTGEINIGVNSGTSIQISPSAGGEVTILSTTASTSSTTGGLKVSGGLGVAGRINVAGYIFSNDITSTRGTAAGVYLFGNNAANFLYYDGTNYSFNGGGLTVVTGGILSGAPTGGLKGTGTVNATAVYDDNVLLTCFGTQYAARGMVDLAQWDAAAPSGKHKLAHKFVAMLKDFDPRDPGQYVQRMMRDEALPGMPTPAEWQHGELSAGEMIQRLWLAVELLAAAFAGAQTKKIT